MPVQFPFIWGKGEIFSLFVLPYFLAHCIFCSMHLISFSLKWKNVSRVIFLTFLICQFHMTLLHLLDLFSALTLFLSLYEINRRNNCWGKWLGVDISGSSKLSPDFLSSSFYNLCLGSRVWEDFAQMLPSVSTYTVLVTSWRNVVVYLQSYWNA